jgi:Na+/H+ antiporter NhaD/arsenite permease-like protein
MSQAIKFFGLLGGAVLLLLVLRWTGLLVFSPRQITSIGIFLMFIIGTLLFGEFRLAFAFGGIALLMLCNLLTVERFTQAASLDVLVFLIGTFLVIGFLEESQFFEHVVSGIVGMIGPRPQRLLLALMVMASVSSALVGEVTAILFMAGAMLHLTNRYKLTPAPFIIMLVFACNIGSAMSSIGNPIGVLIALKTGLGFIDFLKWSAPVALVVNVVTYGICRWWFADAFRAFADAVHTEFDALQRRRAAASAAAAHVAPRTPALAAAGPGGSISARRDDPDVDDYETPSRPSDNVMSSTFFSADAAPTIDGLTPRNTYRLCWAILLGLILMLVTHRLVEHLFGLREGTMMVGAALVMGAVVLLLRREKARELVERRVDWWTLSFFMMLFASVGTLEDTGVTNVIADKVARSGGGEVAVVQIVGWSTGWLSAFLDNVLAVATFMPIVHDIRVRAGAPYTSSIYWMMLFGGTFMGNMTIIGSTANIVAVGLLEKRGHGTIRFGYWMKIGFLVSIASMLVAAALLMLMEHALPGGLPRLEVPHTP